MCYCGSRFYVLDVGNIVPLGRADATAPPPSRPDVPSLLRAAYAIQCKCDATAHSKTYRGGYMWRMMM